MSTNTDTGSGRKSVIPHSEGDQTSSVTIRNAVPADAATLAGLGVHVQELHHRNRPDWFRPADAAAALPLYEMLLSDRAVRAFVFGDNAVPVGYVIARSLERPETPLTWGGTLVDIDQIWVLPGARRHGVGIELVRAVRALADDLGADWLHLTVWDFNQEAQAFFKAAGMKRAMWRMTDP